MKQLFLAIGFLFLGMSVISQSVKNTELISLAKAYKDNMFRNSPDKKYLKKFIESYSADSKVEASFIKETISTGNKLLKNQFLTIPDASVLKNIYIIKRLYLLLREESEITANELVDSLTEKEINRYVLVDNYYGMLFTSIGNKNKPFNLGKQNFVLNQYGLKDEVEQGIFFLRCMDFCGTNIWGFMNIVKPPNTKRAYGLIKKFPSFNGKPYYQFSDLYFKDFDMVIIKDKGMQSYKTYYIDKYYETLLSHLICLNKEGGSQEEARDLLLGSILKDEKLYKYTKQKKLLESIFKKQNKN